MIFKMDGIVKNIKRNIVLFGASGYAKVIIDIIEKQNEYQIVGLIDDFKPVGERLLNHTVIGKIEDLSRLMIEYDIYGGILAIGDNWVRSKAVEKVCSVVPSFKFVNAIHPSSVIGQDVKIGDGSVVMAGVVINPSSSIGAHCILNTNSSIDHDGIMKKFSSLAPNVTTGGNVEIGEFSAISIGSIIIHGKKIGNHTVIGAGSLILKDVGDNEVVFGLPGKCKKKRNEGDRYL